SPGPPSAAVGDRGEVRTSVPGGAGPGDVHRAPAGADRHRRSGVVAVGGAVVAVDPQLGAGGRVVGHRGVIRLPIGCVAGPGDVHRAPAEADRHRRGVVVAVGGAVVAVDPQLGAGGRVVGHRGVIRLPIGGVAGPGDV